VCGGDGARDLAGDLACDAHREHAARTKPLRERVTVEQLHREVGRAVGMPADVIDLDDARVIDARGRARLAKEALEQVTLTAQRGEELFDRGAAAEARIDGGVHDAEATLSELALDPIRADLVLHPPTTLARLRASSRAGPGRCHPCAR
jgi:hypothetical protein